ncbi:MAG TPA: ankyrin repeat domain-containing protein, partial [Candidatus Babeliaceae bacterium]|nr:ankyrin repeat domain-containing protein [Candidatus Babeliaceae bacterium]
MSCFIVLVIFFAYNLCCYGMDNSLTDRELELQLLEERNTRIQIQRHTLDSHRKLKAQGKLEHRFPSYLCNDEVVNAILNNELGTLRSKYKYDKHGETLGNQALHYVTAYGKWDALSLLLDLGADPNATNDYGETPACFAALRGSLEFIVLLKRYGANLTVKSGDGSSIITYATQSDRINVDLLKYLLVHGSAVDEKDPKELGV